MALQTVKYYASLWATGANDYGQLGDGSTILNDVYVRVMLLRDGAWLWCCECQGSIEQKIIQFFVKFAS